MQALRVGPAIVYVRERRVFVDGVLQRLGGRAFDLLLALLKAPERVITRDELFETVWADTAVEPNNLAVQMLALRRLLGPGAIITVPRRGYRLLAPVCALAMEPPSRFAAGGDAPVLQSMAWRLADRLNAEHWITLAGGSTALRRSLAAAACEARRRACGSMVWQIDGTRGALPDSMLQQRLVRTGALLVVTDADAPMRAAIAGWLHGLAPQSPLRVLALANSAAAALAGESMVELDGWRSPETAPAAEGRAHVLRRGPRSKGE